MRIWRIENWAIVSTFQADTVFSDYAPESDLHLPEGLVAMQSVVNFPGYSLVTVEKIREVVLILSDLLEVLEAQDVWFPY